MLVDRRWSANAPRCMDSANVNGEPDSNDSGASLEEWIRMSTAKPL